MGNTTSAALTVGNATVTWMEYDGVIHRHQRRLAARADRGGDSATPSSIGDVPMLVHDQCFNAAVSMGRRHRRPGVWPSNQENVTGNDARRLVGENESDHLRGACRDSRACRAVLSTGGPYTVFAPNGTA